MAPESCSDKVAVVLLINAAAGTAPFVRNLPILVLQFEPEVGSGTEVQGKVLCHSKWDSPMCGLCLEDASHLEGLPVKLSENLPPPGKPVPGVTMLPQHLRPRQPT